jgi:hypothetical protein
VRVGGGGGSRTKSSVTSWRLKEGIAHTAAAGAALDIVLSTAAYILASV